METKSSDWSVTPCQVADMIQILKLNGLGQNQGYGWTNIVKLQGLHLSLKDGGMIKQYRQGKPRQGKKKDQVPTPAQPKSLKKPKTPITTSYVRQKENAGKIFSKAITTI